MAPALIVHSISVATVVAICSTVVLAWVTRPVNEAADRFAKTLRSSFAVGAMLLALGASLTVGLYLGAVLVLCCYVLIRLLKGWFDWQYGGISGAGILVSLAIFESCGVALVLGLARLW